MPHFSSLDINGIIKNQRNRYPVLLIDKILSLSTGFSARGLKNFTYNEWFFPGHFDDDPNVPGFVLIETMVQTFILTFLSKPEYSGLKTNFVSINNIRFTRKVVPGDTLIVDATLKSLKRGLAIGSAIGYVGEQLTCSAEFVVAIPDILEQYKTVSK